MKASIDRFQLLGCTGTTRGGIGDTGTAALWFVRMQAQISGRRVDGEGEIPPVGQLTFRQCARVVSRLADELRTFELDLSDTTAALAGIQKATDHWASAEAFGNRSRTAAATLLGIETALLDIVSRAHATPLPELLGGTSQGRTFATAASVRVPRTTARSAVNRFEREVRDAAGRNDTVELVARDVERCLELASRVGSRVGSLRISVNSRDDELDEMQLLTRVGELMRKGTLPPRTEVHRSTPWRRPAAELQQHADTVVQNGGTESTLQLSVVWTLAALQNAGRPLTTCRTLDIAPHRDGGVLQTLASVQSVLGELSAECRVSGSAVPTSSELARHVLLALAAALPIDTLFGCEARSGTRDRLVRVSSEAATGFTSLEPAAIAAHACQERWWPAIRGAPEPEPNTFEVKPYVSKNSDSQKLQREAIRVGLATMRWTNHAFAAWWPGAEDRKIGFYFSGSERHSMAANQGATDKSLTRMLLERAEVPVAEGAAFPASEREAAIDYGERLGFPVVVKPVMGARGIGVTSGIATSDELGWAVDKALSSRFGPDGLIVERHIDGSDYRVFVLGDRVLSIIERTPANITGDGVRTIGELVASKNILRRPNPYLGRRLIKLDEVALFSLRRNNLTLSSVPAHGSRVSLQAAANLSAGGDSREVLAEAHPSVLQLAIAAVAAIPGLPHAGVDVVMDDHRQPVDDQKIAVIEVNFNAELSLHHYPLIGPARDIASELIRVSARRADISLSDRRSKVTARLVVTGRVQRTGFRRWLRRQATELNVRGWVENAPEPTRVVALLAGSPDAIASLAVQASDGPPRARPIAVSTEISDLPVPAEFEIR